MAAVAAVKGAKKVILAIGFSIAVILVSVSPVQATSGDPSQIVDIAVAALQALDPSHSLDPALARSILDRVKDQGSRHGWIPAGAHLAFGTSGAIGVGASFGYSVGIFPAGAHRFAAILTRDLGVQAGIEASLKASSGLSLTFETIETRLDPSPTHDSLILSADVAAVEEIDATVDVYLLDSDRKAAFDLFKAVASRDRSGEEAFLKYALTTPRFISIGASGGFGWGGGASAQWIRHQELEKTEGDWAEMSTLLPLLLKRHGIQAPVLKRVLEAEF